MIKELNEMYEKYESQEELWMKMKWVYSVSSESSMKRQMWHIDR